MKSKLILALLAITLAGSAAAQVKPEDAIKWRQSGYGFMAWNMARIKMNVEGTYNKEEVIKAATAIQAIANSGMGALYPAGTDKGTGWEKTRAKPEIWANMDDVAAKGKAMREAAAELIAVANAGDEAAFGPAFGKLGGTCKACHDSYRIPEE